MLRALISVALLYMSVADSASSVFHRHPAKVQRNQHVNVEFRYPGKGFFGAVTSGVVSQGTKISFRMLFIGLSGENKK